MHVQLKWKLWILRESITFMSYLLLLITIQQVILMEWVFVDTGKEEADLYIINHVNKNDIVISQDIGLAGLLIRKDVIFITPRGKRYTEANIDTALQFRYLSAVERKSGKYTKGPKKFTDDDTLNFITNLEKILSKHAGELE